MLETNREEGAGFHYSNSNKADVSEGDEQLFYRLKQVDQNGKYIYSKVVPGNPESGLRMFEIFPNPTVEQLFINVIALKRKAVDIKIDDMYGNNVFTKHVGLESGVNKFTVDVSEFLKGTYTFRLLDEINSHSSSVKFVKK